MEERKGVEILGGSRPPEEREPETRTVRGTERKGVKILDKNSKKPSDVTGATVRVRADLAASNEDERSDTGA